MALTYDPEAARRQAVWSGLSTLGERISGLSASRLNVPGPGALGLLASAGGAFGRGYQGYLNQYDLGTKSRMGIEAAQTAGAVAAEKRRRDAFEQRQKDQLLRQFYPDLPSYEPGQPISGPAAMAPGGAAPAIAQAPASVAQAPASVARIHPEVLAAVSKFPTGRQYGARQTPGQIPGVVPRAVPPAADPSLQTAQAPTAAMAPPQTMAQYMQALPQGVRAAIGMAIASGKDPSSILATYAGKTPATATDVMGQRRWLSGPKALQRTFPDVSKPEYSGKVELDKNVGKWFQENPITKKREYISPNEEFLIEGDGQGGFLIRKGAVGTGGDLSKKIQSKLDDSIFASEEGLARLDTIMAGFQPEWLEIPKRLGIKWEALREKMGGLLGEVDPQTKAEIASFSGWRRDAIENINLYIRNLTGAQMSEAEAGRLRLAVPDPGEGIWPKQSTSQFLGTFNSTVKSLRLAAARARYVRKNGLTPPSRDSTGSITLGGMKSIIDKRGAELAKQYKTRNPQAKEGVTDAFVVRMLRNEFGIGK